MRQMDIPPRMTSGTDDGSELVTLVTELATAMESLCAIAAALTLRAGGSGAAPAVDDALWEVLGVLGLGELLSELDRSERQALARVIELRVAQAHDFARAPARAPLSEPPWELLEGQSLCADALAAALRDLVTPQLRGLQRRLESSGSRFLDVGTGLAGLAIALCRQWPKLSGVSIDVSPTVIAGARERIVAAGLRDRVELRMQDAAQLADRESFDFVWLPAGRIRGPALRATLGGVRRATRAGGWIVVGALGGTSPLSIALARLRTARAGGAVMWPSEAETALRSEGWADVRSLPRDTLQSLWMTVGRRPHGDASRADATRRPRPA